MMSAHAPNAPRKLVMIMAASAAMIVAGVGMQTARAQDVAQASSAASPYSGNMMLLNQVQAMRQEMRHMEGRIEVLQHQLQQLQQSTKDQYLNLDSRIGKLEKEQPAAGSSATAPASSAVASAHPRASGKPAPVASAKPLTAAEKAAAQADFDAAFKSLRAGNYVASANGFRAFIKKYPDDPLVPNAYYWLAGSYYVTQNYKPALDAFQTLLKKYPTSSKAAEAKLRVADCEIGLKDYAAARATLQAVIKAHPGTSLERRAHDRMQDLPAAK